MPRSDQGVFTDRYTLIPRTLIFVTREDHVLLLKGSPNKRLWANLYNGVGGHIEQGEDALTAANREFTEETGLKAVDLRLCGTITVDTGERTGIGIYVFRGGCTGGEPKSSPEGTLEWVPFSDIHALNLVEDLYVLLPRVLASGPRTPPFSAHYHYDEREKLIVTIQG